MLAGSRRVAEPAVVADVDKDVGAFGGPGLGEPREDAFVADEGADGQIVRPERSASISCRVGAHVLKKPGEEIPLQDGGDVLAERHQVLLVVGAAIDAVLQDEQGPVVDALALDTRGDNADFAGEERHAAFFGKAADIVRVRGFFEIKGHGRLGPDDEPFCFLFR